MHAEQWGRLVDDALTTRTWLANHQPHLPQEARQPIDLLDARGRIIELEALFDTAPDDVARIVADLTNGKTLLDEADRLEAFASAMKQQSDRSDWILEHWPHVVEHGELCGLVENAGPLDHWPNPLPAAAQDLYNQLAATTADTPGAAKPDHPR